MTESTPQPLSFSLSAESIDAWLRERDEAQEKIAHFQSKVDQVAEKLHAAFVLAPHLFRSAPVFENTPKQEDLADQQKTLIDHVTDALKDIGHGTPADIKKWMEEAGTIEEGPPNNYFYSMLSKGVGRGILAKQGRFYVLARGPE